MHLETLRHTSSVDGTNPLLLDVCFKTAQRKLPLIVVLHGYSGKKEHCRSDILRLAARGLFAVAPDIRGRGDSAGKFDSCGLDVMDVYDAVQFCCRKFAKQVDAKNLNVIGYSGGGGNTFACFVRFPDTFRVAASFFGIPDYAEFYRAKGRPDCNQILVSTVGGTPRQQPAAYAARNFTQAAGNNAQTRFHIFWDEKETACPGFMDEDFIRAGHRNCIPHLSRERDNHRWRHGYTTDSPDLVQADDVFVPEILKRRVAEPELPCAGTLIVPGYVVTRHFQIWVQPEAKPALLGRSGVAKVEYRLSATGPEFRVLSVSKGHFVRVTINRKDNHV